MTPWCVVLVCSWRRLLADRHSLPFPWTLSLHRRWCPSASHHPLTFLFLPALTFPLRSPFLTLGLSLRRPQCPSASPHSFPSHSLGRLCQRSPRTCPVSLLRVESTQRKADAFAVGQVRQSGHPKPAVRYLSPTAAGKGHTHRGGYGLSSFPPPCASLLPYANGTQCESQFWEVQLVVGGYGMMLPPSHEGKWPQYRPYHNAYEYRSSQGGITSLPMKMALGTCCDIGAKPTSPTTTPIPPRCRIAAQGDAL